MKLSERLRMLRAESAAEESAASARRFGDGTQAATIHIAADGDVITDLRDTRVLRRPAATTDMHCDNCGTSLLVDHVDRIAGLAEMHCDDCGFMFHHRLENHVEIWLGIAPRIVASKAEETTERIPRGVGQTA